jgi:hypothetical protein
MPPKKFKTNELTIKSKIDLINDYKSGNFTQEMLADKYRISPGAVNNIIQKFDYYLNIDFNFNKRQKRVINTKNFKLNESVLKFIRLSNSNKVPIDGVIIKTFASDVALRLGLNDFKASNGWLQKLVKRHDIKYRTYRGESADVSDDCVDNWKTTSRNCEKL